ncbi:MAG: sodium/proton-translocating pyrophosphatase [Polyangiaceae bacterium]
MTELALILAIAIVGLGLSGYLVRWVLVRPLGDEEMNRVANAIRLACEGFMRRQASTILALSGLCTGAVFLAYGLRRGGEEAISRLETGVWLTLACAVGAASVILIGQVVTFVSTRATIRVASGARRSIDGALVIALRGGAVIGLVTTTLTTLGAAALILAILLYHGALSDDPSGVAQITPAIPMFLTGFALGGGFAALLCHFSGGFFAKSSDIGADVGGREAGLDDDDPANPATIANLAGDCVGECVGQSTSAFGAAVGEDLAVMLAGAYCYAENPTLKSALTLTLLPILARSFGLVGAAFGVMIVRTDEQEKPESALFRGFAVAGVLHAVGFAGAAKWLLPRHWIEVSICCGMGLLASFLSLPIVNQFATVRGRVREISEVARAGPAVTVLAGLVAALDAFLVPALLVAAVALGAYWTGAHTGLVGGGLFGIAIAMLGFVGSTPYLTSLAASATMIDAAAGVVVMSVGRDRPDVRGRLLVLDTIGATAKAHARLHSAMLGIFASALLVAAFLRVTRGATAGGASALGQPVCYVAAIFGVGFVAWLLARATGGVARCSRRVLDEVRRQLGGRARAKPSDQPRSEDDGAAVTADYGPCVEIASRFALRHLLLPGVGAIALPVLAFLGVRLLARPPFDVSTSEAIATLAISVGVGALLVSVAVASAGAGWSNAKKYVVTHGGRLLVDDGGADNPTYVAASVGDAIGDALKDVGVPAIQLFARLLPVIALVMAPFLVQT